MFMSGELYCVEIPVEHLPNQGNRETRFVTFFGNEFSGLRDLQMVKLNKVIYKDKSGALVGARKTLEFNQRMVDTLQESVAQGNPQKWLATARVLQYFPKTHEFKIAYSGSEKETIRAAEPEIPKAFLAADGTYRRPPTVGFSKGPRQWALAVAHVDRNTSVAYADRFNGATKLETIQRLFDPFQPAWILDYVLTLPLADPADIPLPVEPVVEVPLTAAEIEAIAPFDYAEYEKISSAEYKRRYVMDERFRVACDKMFVIRAAFEEKMRLKHEAEATQESLAAEKRKYQRLDANEEFKRDGK
jgi:hypothetical protein